MPWKNTIATDQTAAAPPSRGSTILVNIGWTANSNAALIRMDAKKVANSKLQGEEAVCVIPFAGSSEPVMSQPWCAFSLWRREWPDGHGTRGESSSPSKRREGSEGF